ncbi:MAG TPA: HAMP domain-containing sensor histidine kinase [Thermohalobaculum sp.]|nr:HAMP domain-containing sensor histidine kinase [Thermohalobaculum sp.]
MPVAMAALDVAGQIRERSPADTAIFGEDAARLTERFVQRDRGQALLARAVTDGSAEGIAWLITGAGQQRFRISLWRQRGGERVRILVAFSACETAEPVTGRGLPEDVREALLRLCHDMRSPLAAVIGFAEMIRAGTGRSKPGEAAVHASDIVAAAWRLMRIAEDLETAGSTGEASIPVAPGEVDIARLARRVVRLATPAAAAAQVSIDPGGLPGRGESPLVLGDERTLWSVLDSLLENAVHHAGPGAEVRLGLSAPGARQGLVLEIADNGPGLEADALARLLEGHGPGRGIVLSRALARANGAELEFESAPGQGLTARLAFPAARCLDPV